MMHFLKKHRLVSGITLIACLSSGLFILLFDRVEQQYAEVVKAQQVKDFATLDKAVEVKIARLKAQEAAKKEAEANTEQQKKTETEANAASPSSNSVISSSAHRNPARIDVLVNKKHPLIPLDFTPKLSTIACAGRGASTVSTQAVADFSALCQAAAAASLPLDTSSSYRSYSTQVSTYNHWVSVSGKKSADTYSARPGYSEHQTGLAVDFRVPSGATLSDFTGTPQQKWLANNAWRYGFIQRYTVSNQKDTGYTAESWHFRYVGRTLAGDYTSRGIRSLESYWRVSGGDYN